MGQEKVKVGVFGVGHLGSIHLKCLGLVEQAETVGFYDPDDEAAGRAIKSFGVRRYDTIDELLNDIDMADIVAPTVHHFDLAQAALTKGRHVFIEKPVCSDLEEGERLLETFRAGDHKVQIGHVERFNPAMLALRDEHLDPKFIEGHRLSTFNPRGTDVSVVMDLMIHDLDIILQLVSSEVEDVQANGVSVVSETPDICNARISFANGCVANLTASRISFKQLRKIRLFQRDAYISMDFMDKSSEIIRLFHELAHSVAVSPSLIPPLS